MSTENLPSRVESPRTTCALQEDDETAIMMAKHNARNDAVQVLLEAGAQLPADTATAAGAAATSERTNQR